MVKGFTLKVQDFCKKIIRHLIAEGANVQVGYRGHRYSKGQHQGKVSGIIINGELEEYDNYLYRSAPMPGRASAIPTNNQLHGGVLGVWLTIPNLYPN